MPEPIESPTRILDAGALDPMIGRQVRDLRVVERIGRGGMGTVYKAEHLLLREPRALKVMRAELFQALPQAVERFEREARIAVRLRHPNLVLLHDFFVEGGDRFLVMEYVVGKSLSTLLEERGALPVDVVCRIGIQCCEGLAHAHEMGIVHRDLSPENVMITTLASGHLVKIIDFGVARAAFESSDQPHVDEDATLTRVGQFIGKPRYSSPEQAGSLARGERVDQRSDLYTLGLILFEMATASFPFHSENDIGFLAKHSFERPATPTDVRPDLRIPAGLERVILRCLEKDRSRRFASAQDLRAALEWVLQSGGQGTAPFDRDAPAPIADPEAAGRVRAPRRARSERSPVPFALAAALTLAGVAVGAAAWWFAPRGEKREAVVSEAPEPESAAVPAAPPLVVISEPEPAEAVMVEPEPVPVEPEPETESAPSDDVEPAAPIAEVQPRVEEPPPVEIRSPPPAPRVEPAAIAPFASAAEMSRAFEEALEFERTHDSTASVSNWKQFRSRSPSRELDERAKRRITDLILGGLREVR